MWLETLHAIINAVDACDDIVTESFHMKKGSEGKRGAFVMTLTIK